MVCSYAAASPAWTTGTVPSPLRHDAAPRRDADHVCVRLSRVQPLRAYIVTYVRAYIVTLVENEGNVSGVFLAVAFRGYCFRGVPRRGLMFLAVAFLDLFEFDHGTSVFDYAFDDCLHRLVCCVASAPVGAYLLTILLSV